MCSKLLLLLLVWATPAWAVEVYLAEWEWNDKEEQWQSPGGTAIGSLDLRSLPQMAAKGTGTGYGVFVYDTPQVIPGSLDLGNDLDKPLNGGEKATLKSALKLPGMPTSATPRELLWDMLGKYADPTGVNGPKPLMPTLDNRLDLHLGGFSLIRSEPFDIATHPNRDKVVSVLQGNYRKVRVDGGRYKEYLDVLEKKFGVSYGTFIPADLPDEGTLPHQTTVSDNFNRADESLDAGAWVETAVNWSVVSNQAQMQVDNAAGIARYTTALSSDNMTSDVDAISDSPALEGCIGSTTRMSTDASPNHDGYWGCIDPDVDNIGLFKIVDGTRTSIGSFPAFIDSLPDTHRLSANGSTIENIVNGSTLQSVTDTAITGNLYAGIGARRSFDTLDNFTASDIATRRVFLVN